MGRNAHVASVAPEFTEDMQALFQILICWHVYWDFNHLSQWDLLPFIILRSVGCWRIAGSHVSHLSDSIYLIEFMLNNRRAVMQLVYSDRCHPRSNNITVFNRSATMCTCGMELHEHWTSPQHIAMQTSSSHCWPFAVPLATERSRPQSSEQLNAVQRNNRCE